MIPLKGVFPHYLCKEIGVLLGGGGDGSGSVPAGSRVDVDGGGHLKPVGVSAGAQGEKGKERRAGEQGEDVGGLRHPGVMAQELDFYLALVVSPDDITGHGDDTAGLEVADALDGGKGGAAFLINADDGDSGPAQVIFLHLFDALFFLDAHIEQESQVACLLAEESGRHFPVAQMRHEQDTALFTQCGG